MLTLEYGREYRTFFHLGMSWGLRESRVCRIVRRAAHILKRAERSLCQARRAFNNPTTNLKIFRTFAKRYRNRRRRFSLRFNLIAGLHNFELDLDS